jgi:hypothetical protein
MISPSRFNHHSLAVAFTILSLVPYAISQPSIPVTSKVNFITKPPTASFVLLVDKKTEEPSPSPSKVYQSSKVPSSSPSLQSNKVVKAKSSKQKKMTTKGKSGTEPKKSKGKGSSQYYSTKAPKAVGKGSTQSPSQTMFSQSISSSMSASVPVSAADTFSVVSRFSVLLFCLVPCYFLM